MSLASNASGLFELARCFGDASTLLAVQGSARGVEDLFSEFYSLRRLGVITDEQLAHLQELHRNGTAPHFPPRDEIDLLSTIEGQILGRLVRERVVPTEERARWATLLAGGGGIDTEGILEAHRRIRAPWIISFLRERGIQPFGIPHHVRRTRLERCESLEERIGRRVYLKREDDQPVGSFKNRGATNFLVTALLAGFDPATLKIGTASHGNHALGVVQAAHNLGVRHVDVLLPQNASPFKVAQLKVLGARVEFFGETLEDCVAEIARRASQNPNYLFLPAFDQPLVVMGQGTVAVELSLQMSIQDHRDYATLVPAGGGGLIAGIATYLNRDPSRPFSVIGAESKAHPYVSRSFHLKRIAEPDEIKHIDTVADGIAFLKIGQAGFQSLLNYVQEVHVVPEPLIEATVAFLRENGLTLEGAAATTVASLLFGLASLPSNGPVAVIATGRNIDPALLARLAAEHGEGRWRLFHDRLERLKARLARSGFFSNGTVRSLEGAEDGIAFVDLLAANLPEGWDLIDALELLDFGPWREKKDINGTLRSFGQYHQRWNHSKEEALTHPESNRGQILEGCLPSLGDPARREEILSRLPLVNAHRLEVEIHVMALYLARPDWLERLRPSLTLEEREAHFDGYRAQNDRLRVSVRKFRETIENT